MAYITESEADTYFEGHLFSDAWDNATTANRTKAREHATRILNRLRYKGTKTDDAQDDEFPRDITNDVVPQEIIDATAEIALALLDGINPEREIENISVTSQGYAQARSTYNRDFVQFHVSAGVPSATAWSLIRKFLANPDEVKISRVS